MDPITDVPDVAYSAAAARVNARVGSYIVGPAGERVSAVMVAGHSVTAAAPHIQRATLTTIIDDQATARLGMWSAGQVGVPLVALVGAATHAVAVGAPVPALLFGGAAGLTGLCAWVLGAQVRRQRQQARRMLAGENPS